MKKYEEAVLRVLSEEVVDQLRQTCLEMPNCYLCRFSIKGLVAPEEAEFTDCIFANCPEAWEFSEEDS